MAIIFSKTRFPVAFSLANGANAVVNGRNQLKIIAPEATTTLDDAIWNEIKTSYKTNDLIANGLIYAKAK